MEISKEKVANKYLDIVSYEITKKIIQQMEQDICKIKIKVNQKYKQCTGFFCSIPFPDTNNMMKVLITSNGIINKSILNNNEKIFIEIKGEKDTKILNLKRRFIYTNKLYKITIIEIKEEDDIKSCLELDDKIIDNIISKKHKNDEYINNTIYMLQYPDEKLSVSYGKIEEINNDKKYYFSHNCNAKEDLLGSPILNINNKVIGIYNKNDESSFLDYPIIKFIMDNLYNNNINKRIIKLDEYKRFKNIMNLKLYEIFIKKFNSYNNLFNNFSKKYINTKYLHDFKIKYKLNIKDNNIKKLDFSGNKIGNKDFEKLCKIEFKELNELYLGDNDISNINPLEKANFNKLKILLLCNNIISDINILSKVNLKELKILKLHYNDISDIGVLEKVKFNKLEILYLSGNKISDINILSKVNFNELKNLNLYDNNITDIEVLENVKFDKLEILYLSGNKLSDISVLEKVNFKELKELNLYDNNISDIKVLEKVKFNKLENLDLMCNNIDTIQNASIISNLKSRIKNFEF